MSTSDEFEQLCWRTAAGVFLTDYPPEDFFELDSDERTEWVDNHKWEPFNYHSAEQVEEWISEHAAMLQITFEIGK